MNFDPNNFIEPSEVVSGRELSLLHVHSSDPSLFSPVCMLTRYHEWMQDPVLRSQTASEPLTLQQEYEMQLSWMRDDDSKFEQG